MLEDQALERDGIYTRGNDKGSLNPSTENFTSLATHTHISFMLRKMLQMCCCVFSVCDL